MKHNSSVIIEFSEDESVEGESYLLRAGDDDPINSEPTPRPLNRILRDARRKLNLTQQEMADLMGVSLRSYKGYELQEVRTIPAAGLQALAERTQISPAYLLTGYDPPIDYYAVVDEVLSLQAMIWQLCKRPNGNEYGMSEELDASEALAVANGLLSKRDRLRAAQDNSDLQVTKQDIYNAVEEWTDHNRVADLEWAAYHDPAYYGGDPFPCPAMYVVPRFRDMIDFKNYTRLRHEIYRNLTVEDRAVYHKWSKLKPTSVPDG